MLEILLRLAGAGQIALALASIAIPKQLGWKQELTAVSPLTRKMFWTYAAYILVAHLCFGALSLFAADHMIDGSLLATVITGFIAAWWLARLGIQFLVFKPSDRPEGLRFILAELALVSGFVAFAGLYLWAMVSNL